MNKEFFKEWFGSIGRELGKPERFFTRDYRDLIKLAEKSRRDHVPCFCSVQPFMERDKPCMIERLFFDLDCKEDPEKAWDEALSLAETIINFYGALPLIVFSGNKGYHIYVWLKRPYQIDRLEEAHEIYREMQMMLLRGLDLKTCDPQPLGDIKRLSRCPYTVNEKSGKLCQPVSLTHRFLEDVELGLYRKYGLPESFVELATLRVKRKKLERSETKNAIVQYNSKRIRPCIQALFSHSEPPHLMRVALVAEYRAAGYSPEEIIGLFRNFRDWDEEETRYQVMDIIEGDYKPFKCSTIRSLGFCLGDGCRRGAK